MTRLPKYRSDLAFAAGFAALALIFSRFSLNLNDHARLIFDLARPEEVVAAVWFLLRIPLSEFPAPLALWLGMKAWSDLKRHPEKSGKAPAVIGIVVGFGGTLILLFEIYQVVETLWSFLPLTGKFIPS